MSGPLIGLIGTVTLLVGQVAASLAPPAAAQPAAAAPAKAPTPAECAAPAHLLPVDLGASVIKWKGTKLWGLGSHEGTVRLKAGELCMAAGTIKGGSLVVDMRTIEVTDIPASDPEPRQNLTHHLMSDDFFQVAAHPEARLVLTSVKAEKERLYRATAALTIRGVTHPVAFFVRAWTLTDREVHAETRFEVNRQLFGVSFRGSVIGEDLVDDEFTLAITIRARAPNR